jgi:hypothetical protein
MLSAHFSGSGLAPKHVGSCRDGKITFSSGQYAKKESLPSNVKPGRVIDAANTVSFA